MYRLRWDPEPVGLDDTVAAVSVFCVVPILQQCHAAVGVLLKLLQLAVPAAAVGCRVDAINGDTLTLHRTKTGELVVIPLPELVLDSLREIEGVFGTDHYFWSGTILRVSATKQWRIRLQHVGRMAGLQNFRPHQLRDTFAVEFLLSNKSIEDLSALLGHSSVNTTERYYAPWVAVRRDRLIRIVKEVNDSDSMLQCSPCWTRRHPWQPLEVGRCQSVEEVRQTLQLTRRECPHVRDREILQVGFL